MVVYITSSPTGTYLKWDIKEFDGFNMANGMVREMKKDIGKHVRCLVIAASPDAYESNDQMIADFKERFEDSGFMVDCIEICDH